MKYCFTFVFNSTKHKFFYSMKDKNQLVKSELLKIEIFKQIKLPVIRSMVWLMIMMVWVTSSAKYDWMYWDQIAPSIFIITMVLVMQDYSKS